MNPDDQPGAVPETPEESASNLENFDLRTPAEIEAAGGEPEPVTPTETIEEEPPKPPVEGEEPLVEEPKPYQPPQRVKVEVEPFKAEIPLDEYGNIDPTKFGEYQQARDEHLVKMAKAEAQNAMYETNYMQREWSDVGAAYPEIVENESLRSMAESMRIADALQGGDGSLMKAAEQIAEIRKTEREAGKAEAQTTITRQKSVSLQSSPRTQNIDANKTANLRKQAATGDENARIKYMQELIKTGALNA